MAVQEEASSSDAPGQVQVNDLQEGATALSSLPLDPGSGKHRLWWQLFSFLIVSIGLVLVSSSFNAQMDRFMPEAMSFPSTYNTRQSGYSGLLELTRKTGRDSGTWELPYRNLKDVRGTLVIVAPSETPSDLDVKNILKWVRQGNDLIYLDYFVFRSGRHLIGNLGLEAYDAKSVTDESVPLGTHLPEAAFAPKLIVSAESRLKGGNALLEDESGVLLSQVNAGAGRCLVGTIPLLGSNRHFSQKQNWSNFQFLINWFATSPGKIFFDERCHGYSSGGSLIIFLAKSPVGYVCLQLLIIALVAFFSANHRFGMPEPLLVKRRISNLDFIEGLAAALRRARARDTAWSMIFSSFKARLCKALTVSPQDSPEQISQSWAESSGLSQRECEAFLKQSQSALDRGTMSEAELLDLVGTCDRLFAHSKELLKAGRVRGA